MDPTLAARRASELAALVLLLALPQAVSGQTRNIRFERIQVEQGLPQGTVNAILQDRVGFMWFGTQDGLARYDGKRFRVYGHDPTDPATLPNDFVLALLEDPSGDLWIGTQGGLSRWLRDSDSFVSYRHDPDDPASLSDDRISSLHFDSQGFLWVGTSQSGLNRFQPDRAASPGGGSFERFRHHSGDSTSLSDDRVRAIYEDRLSVLWVATLRGLNLFDRQSNRFIRLLHDPGKPLSLRHDAVRAIHEDHEGVLWIGTLGGLNRLDRATLAFERPEDRSDASGATGETVRVLFEDRQGRLWVGTDDGLSLLHRPSGTFRHYRNVPTDVYSLSDNRITSIYQDRGGVLWVGTQSAGINKWNPITWAFSHHRNEPTGAASRESNHVLALTEDAEGGLWVGTSGGGLQRFDRTTHNVRRYRHDPDDATSLSNDQVTALLHDREGTLWAGTLTGGLQRFDADSESFERFNHDPARADSLGSDGVISLYEDRRGNLWIGTLDGGLNHLDRGDGRFRRFRHDGDNPASLSNDRVSAFAETADGSLWVGTLGGGLNLLDLNLLDPGPRARQEPRPGQREAAAFLRVRRDAALPAGLSNDTVYSLHVDSGGGLWVGTQVGLNRLTGLDRASGRAVFKRYFERDGLPNDSIYGIHSDADDNLWLSTNRGLSRFDRTTETFKNYTASHGLQSNEFNFGAHFQSRSGELFFGGVNGFNAFYPDRIQHNLAVPPVVLTSFSKLNQPVQSERPIFDLRAVELDPGDTVFSFEFAALDFTAPAENRYRYMVEGWDESWIDLGNHSRVTFSNFDPGDYVLRVQGSNNDGVWNRDGITLAIRLRPPLWKTWWFRLSSFLVLAALIAYSLRARMVQLTNERLQTLVVERTRALEETQEKLFRRKKLAVLGELAGSVAHELRNPLGTIRNAVYYLRLTASQPASSRSSRPAEEAPDGSRPAGEPFGAKLQEYLELIDREVERSNRIISELLDWGRAPAADLDRCVLQEVFERAISETAIPDAIRIEKQFADAELVVEVDRGQIHRVLTNLLTNAIEAMPEGGNLRLECRRRGEEALAAVTDTGVGIAETNLSRIFEPLFSGKSKGVGLGLPLSQRYANLNHGRIECESKLGEGASFRLVLPAAPPADAASQPLALADRVATDRVATDRVATDRVATDRVATDRVATDRVATDRVGAEGLRSSVATD